MQSAKDLDICFTFWNPSLIPEPLCRRTFHVQCRKELKYHTKRVSETNYNPEYRSFFFLILYLQTQENTLNSFFLSTAILFKITFLKQILLVVQCFQNKCVISFNLLIQLGFSLWTGGYKKTFFVCFVWG